MDNLWLGRYPKIAGFVVDEAKMLRDTKAIFEELGIDVDPKRIMSTMPVSQRQMVEIAKAVSYHSKVIVFDEPTSSLTEEEVEHLFKIINMLRDRRHGYQSTFLIKWRRSSGSPTRSPSCATASTWRQSPQASWK